MIFLFAVHIFPRYTLFIAVLIAVLLTGCSRAPAPNSNTANTSPQEPVPSTLLSEESKTLLLGDAKINVVVTRQEPPSPGIVYVNLHDNENTSVDAARHVIATTGGSIVELRSTGKRLLTFSAGGSEFTCDPNRIFTDEGIRKTLTEHGKYSPEAHKTVAHFANELIKDYFSEAKIIVALHNNTDAEYSVESYMPGQEYAGDAADIFLDQARDIDDFFFVTEPAYFEKLSGAGFNVVLQDNLRVTDDGSFSVYCGKNGIGYINVEAEHGHFAEQVSLLEALQNVIPAR